MTNTTKPWVVFALIALCASFAAPAEPSRESKFAKEIHTWNIPAEDAVAAVRDFGLQSGIAVFADFAQLTGKRFNAVMGSLTVHAALAQLVAGTGLEYQYNPNARAISFRTIPAQPKQYGAGGSQEQKLRVNSEPVLLEEIVVTAQKRPESLQEVPISIQVFTSTELRLQNLNSLIDVSQVAPSVNVVGSEGRSGGLYIRGIGSGAGAAFDQSVGTFIDDVYHGRTEYSFAQFLDLDRVEILKGPQGTFFGNDAIAGAYNIVTKKPQDEFASSLRGLYGMFGRYEAEGTVNVPVNDHFQIRAAALANGEDGWLKNVNTGEKYPHQNSVAARITARVKPKDGLDATLKVEGSQNREGGGLFVSIVGCPPPAPFKAAGFCKSIDPGLPQGLRHNSTSETPGQRIDLSTHEEVLSLNYRRWNHTFTSVSGFTAYHYQQDFDAAETQVKEINVSSPELNRQFSQELRAASSQNQRFEYLAGLYFQADRLVSDLNQIYFFLGPVISANTNLNSLVPFLPLGQDVNYRQLERIYSGFASGTLHLTDTLSLSVGLRASQVKKDYTWRLFYGTAGQTYGGVVALPSQIAKLPASLGLGTPSVLSGGRLDHAVTPSFRAQYQFAQAARVYFSYSSGFKAGGFNASDNSGQAKNLPFDPEHANAYEVGVKTELPDRNLLLDVAVFRSHYTDLQVSRNFPNAAGSFVATVGNGATVLSQGVELQGNWMLGRHFSLTVNGTYLDSHYTSYLNASPTTLQAFEGYKAFNQTGWPTFYAPKWSGSFTGTYTTALPSGYRIVAAIEPIATSDYFNNALDLRAGAYVRLDSRLTLESSSGRWNLDVIGQNLADRDIVVFQGPQATAPGTLNEQKERPRSVAMQMRVEW